MISILYAGEVLETLLDEVSYINNVGQRTVFLFANPPITKEPGIEINSIIDDALFLVFKEMGGEKISINKHLTDGLPSITGDANLLQQFLVNIMQNALEAMPDEGTLGIRSWLHAGTCCLLPLLIQGAAVCTA